MGLKPLKKSHLTSGHSMVPLIIRTEMKVSCLCFSLVNDAPVPLCNSKTITLWDLEYFQKIIPINTADVFSAANEAHRVGPLTWHHALNRLVKLISLHMIGFLCMIKGKVLN